MSLKSLIVELGADKTASELVAMLNAQSVEVRDDQLYTWAGVALIAGPQGAEAFRLALESNGMGWAVHQLGGSGLQLSNPLTQAALAAFAQASVPGAAELKAAGIHYISPFINGGGVGIVSESDVQAELAAIHLEATKRQLLAEANDQWNAFVAAVEAWDGVGDPPVMGG